MLQYPLFMSFKIVVFNPQVSITDAAGKEVLYVKQSALSLKEDIKVYRDRSMATQLFQIKADRIIDFSANYTISSADGTKIGAIKRKGMKSIWRASYIIFNAAGEEVGHIHEENPWLKLLDSFLSEIPFLSMLVNPSYLIDYKNMNILYLKKMPAVFEGKFELTKKADLADNDENLMIPALIMSMMLERHRG